MKKTQVSMSEYWDFFWEQFDMEEANSGGYAEYDTVWKRTKEYYSRTTSKHITQYLNGRKAEEVEQSFINQLVGV